MELYSGRLDILPNENQQHVKKHLSSFFNLYGSKEHDFIVAYEEKTKAGLPCKPHVHFLFYSANTHDRMRKTLSGYGYKGSLGSLSKVSANPKWSVETTYSYVLKQQTVLISNLLEDELQEKLEQANSINNEIRDKMTTFQQHWDKAIVPQLIEFDNQKKEVIERIEIIKIVHKYITLWNNYNIEEPAIQFPSKQTLLQLIQRFESKYIPEEIACNRFLQDNGFNEGYIVAHNNNYI